MIYLFRCEKCDEDFELNFSMNDDEGRKNAKCSLCGEGLTRVWSTPAINVKQDSIIGTRGGTSFVKDGKEVKIGFANHGKRHGLNKRSIGNKIGGTRVDEKTGRLVVDVVSNIKDPLGTLEKVQTETIKKQINQKVKVRK